jgi:hypothetical protein
MQLRCLTQHCLLDTDECETVRNELLALRDYWSPRSGGRFFTLGAAAFFDMRYALPGFHIFVFDGSDRSGDDPAPRAHFDLQWMHAIPGRTPSETLSFTLLIEEPSGGASLAVWGARCEDVVKLGVTSIEYASIRPPETVTYARGGIVIHDGLILHAIGSPSVSSPKGYRITLQGHGVRLPQGWLLYW